MQSFTYACDQNNVIDVSQYLYYAELVEEIGTLTPIAVTACDGTLVRERKADVDCASTGNIASLSTALTIDGFATSIGSLVLVKDQTDHTQNCIYYVPGASAWTRVSNLLVQADFTPGFLVRVKNGTVKIRPSSGPPLAV